jgi:glycosyltransferase involved in cell wall biosynthesis
MPVYNGEKYLRTAVQSILDQSFSDFELIVVDDGSIDGTARILAELADPRIRYLRNRTYIGVISSRNRGISVACGRFIALMDADDISLPCRLERQVHYLEAHPETGLLGSWIEFIDGNGKRTGTWRPPTAAALIRWCLLFTNCFAQSSVILRHSVVERVGLYDPEAIYCEDYDLWSRISFETQIVNLPEFLVRYRVHPASISAKKDVERQRQTAIRVMRYVASRILRREISKEEMLGLHRATYGPPLNANEEIESVATLIEELFESYCSYFSPGLAERRQIALDAAQRVLNLFRGRTSMLPHKSLSILLRSMRLDPRPVPYLALLQLCTLLGRKRDPL